MLTSLGLAYISGHSTKSSIMMDGKAPIEQQAAPAAPEESPQPQTETPQPAKPAQTE